MLTEADDVRVADQLDTAHHKMDSVICSHRVYKSVWSPIIENLVLEKEPTCQSTRSICSGSDKGFSDSGPHSVRKFTHRSHGII